MIRSTIQPGILRETRPSSLDTGQLASDGVALMSSVLVLGVLYGKMPESWHASVPPPSVSQPSIEISLQATPDAPTPVLPVPPLPVPPQKPLAHPPLPKQAQAPRMPSPVPQEPAARSDPDPVPEGGAVVAAATPAAPALRSDSRPDLDAQYAAALRTDIDRRTAAPDSAQYRLHRPSGAVRVSFVVTRTGESRSVHIAQSSGSSILDDQALGIVASGHYPAMPSSAYAGETEHVFVVTIEFRRAS